MVKSLLKKGYPAYLSPAPELALKGIRVQVGNLKTRKEAETLILQIKARENIQGFVTQIK